MSSSSDFLKSPPRSVTGVSVPLVTNSSGLPVPEGCVTTQFFAFLPWDNEHNLVSREVENIFNLIFTGICLPLLFIVAFCTNILSMLVFYKHGLQERINACLFTLSLVDLLSITVSFGYCSDVLYMFAIRKGGELGAVTQFFIKYYLTSLYSLVTASQMVYSVIAVERCLCITKPLLVKTFMSTRTTVVGLWVMVFIITGGAVFVFGPIYSVVCLFDPLNGKISYINYPPDFYFENKFLIDLLYGTLYALFFPAISLVSVSVCTIITVVKLKKLSRWRETVSSASDSVSSRDLAITRIVVGTSILFIICIVPAVVVRLTPMVIPDLVVGGRYNNLAWATRRVYQLASAVNNSFNFFIYYIYGSKFRETTRQLCSCYGVKNIPDKTVPNYNKQRVKG
ncbi:hypothetical protein ACOMHN_051708 [Nucella lapillus]